MVPKRTRKPPPAPVGACSFRIEGRGGVHEGSDGFENAANALDGCGFAHGDMQVRSSVDPVTGLERGRRGAVLAHAAATMLCAASLSRMTVSRSAVVTEPTNPIEATAQLLLSWRMARRRRRVRRNARTSTDDQGLCARSIRPISDLRSKSGVHLKVASPALAGSAFAVLLGSACGRQGRNRHSVARHESPDRSVER